MLSRQPHFFALVGEHIKPERVGGGLVVILPAQNAERRFFGAASPHVEHRLPNLSELGFHLIDEGVRNELRARSGVEFVGRCTAFGGEPCHVVVAEPVEGRPMVFEQSPPTVSAGEVGLLACLLGREPRLKLGFDSFCRVPLPIGGYVVVGENAKEEARIDPARVSKPPHKVEHNRRFCDVDPYEFGVIGLVKAAIAGMPVDQASGFFHPVLGFPEPTAHFVDRRNVLDLNSLVPSVGLIGGYNDIEIGFAGEVVEQEPVVIALIPFFAKSKKRATRNDDSTRHFHKFYPSQVNCGLHG